MNPRPFAWIVGILFLLIGLGGFVPPLVEAQASALRVAAGAGEEQLLGLFGVSTFLNVLRIVFGAWGVYSGRSLGSAVRYARRLCLLCLLLAIVGTIPGPDTLFGLAPLYGNNLLLHGLLAIAAFLFGWLYRRPAALPAPRRRPPLVDY